MKRKPTFARIGSISGLDPEADPIGDLAFALKQLLKRCRVSRETRKGLVATLQLASSWMPESEIPQDDIIDALEAALGHFAPPYSHFGQADSYEFGFWPDLDADVPRVPAGLTDDKYVWGEDVILVNDHGNASCGHFDLRGMWHEYWSVV